MMSEVNSQLSTKWSRGYKMGTNKKQRHVDYEKKHCPVEATLELIGGKWKGIILYTLLDGRRRHSELLRDIGCVTQRMLTKQLRELEACGLVNRIVHTEVPLKVEYELTEDGVSLEAVLNALKAWGETNGTKLISNLNSP